MINNLPFLFISFMICIIIGLPCYFTGCEDTIQPNCSRYWVKTTYVASYGARDHTCKRCIHSTRTCTTDSNGKNHCQEKCDTYYYYDCYDGYDIEYYDHNNKEYTCNFYAGKNLLSRDAAIKSAESKYPIGSNYDRYINKMTKECYTATGIVALAITGFVFLLLGAIFLSMIIYIICVDFFSKNKFPNCIRIFRYCSNSFYGNYSLAPVVQATPVYQIDTDVKIIEASAPEI